MNKSVKAIWTGVASATVLSLAGFVGSVQADIGIPGSACKATGTAQAKLNVGDSGAVYNNHTVDEITRSDSEAKNLTQTTSAISELIDFAKQEGKKTICFVTGVPGAGKTLVGLKVATQHLDKIKITIADYNIKYHKPENLKMSVVDLKIGRAHV